MNACHIKHTMPSSQHNGDRESLLKTWVCVVQKARKAYEMRVQKAACKSAINYPTPCLDSRRINSLHKIGKKSINVLFVFLPLKFPPLA